MGKGPYDSSFDDDQRMHPRSEYVACVSYREVVDDNAENPLQGDGLTQDISYAGICIMLNREFSPGSLLELKFEPTEKHSKPIITRARVIWQKKTELGFLTGLKFKMD